MKPKLMSDFKVGNKYQYTTITEAKPFPATLEGYGPQLPGKHLMTITLIIYDEEGSHEVLASFLMVGRDEKDLTFTCVFNNFK